MQERFWWYAHFVAPALCVSVIIYLWSTNTALELCLRFIFMVAQLCFQILEVKLTKSNRQSLTFFWVWSDSFLFLIIFYFHLQMEGTIRIKWNLRSLCYLYCQQWAEFYKMGRNLQQHRTFSGFYYSAPFPRHWLSHKTSCKFSSIFNYNNLLFLHKIYK